MLHQPVNKNNFVAIYAVKFSRDYFLKMSTYKLIIPIVQHPAMCIIEKKME